MDTDLENALTIVNEQFVEQGYELGDVITKHNIEDLVVSVLSTISDEEIGVDIGKRLLEYITDTYHELVVSIDEFDLNLTEYGLEVSCVFEQVNKDRILIVFDGVAPHYSYITKL